LEWLQTRKAFRVGIFGRHRLLGGCRRRGIGLMDMAKEAWESLLSRIEAMLGQRCLFSKCGCAGRQSVRTGLTWSTPELSKNKPSLPAVFLKKRFIFGRRNSRRIAEAHRTKI
jgi:hypothetical protein